MKLTLEQLTDQLEAIAEVKEDIERRHEQLAAETLELQQRMARLARISLAACPKRKRQMREPINNEANLHKRDAALSSVETSGLRKANGNGAFHVVNHYCALDLVENYLRRFIIYPSEHALVAHALWIAHAHLMDCWDTSPRMAFMSPEKESGKTRALEVTSLLVPDHILSFNMSSASVIRLVAEKRRTVLFDEIDGLFGSAMKQEMNGDLCGFMNAGYRRGARAYRCSTAARALPQKNSTPLPRLPSPAFALFPTRSHPGRFSFT